MPAIQNPIPAMHPVTTGTKDAASIPAKQAAIPTEAMNIIIFWENLRESQAQVSRPARITIHSSVAMDWL